MRRTEHTSKLVFLAVGILFLVIGAAFIISFARPDIHMDGSRQVSATVVEVIKGQIRGRHRRYRYVYEYTDGGEVRRYASNATTTVRLKVGSKKTLFISEDGRVYERTGAVMTLFIGIAFALMGVTFMLMTFKMLKNKVGETER